MCTCYLVPGTVVCTTVRIDCAHDTTNDVFTRYDTTQNVHTYIRVMSPYILMVSAYVRRDQISYGSTTAEQKRGESGTTGTVLVRHTLVKWSVANNTAVPYTVGQETLVRAWEASIEQTCSRSYLSSYTSVLLPCRSHVTTQTTQQTPYTICTRYVRGCTRGGPIRCKPCCLVQIRSLLGRML